MRKIFNDFTHYCFYKKKGIFSFTTRCENISERRKCTVKKEETKMEKASRFKTRVVVDFLFYQQQFTKLQFQHRRLSSARFSNENDHSIQRYLKLFCLSAFLISCNAIMRNYRKIESNRALTRTTTATWSCIREWGEGEGEQTFVA